MHNKIRIHCQNKTTTS